MTAVNPPSYLQAGGNTALSDRLTVASLLAPSGAGLGAVGGVRPSIGDTGMAVSPNATPNNQVIVQPGTVVIPDGLGGVYVCHNDSAVALTISAAATSQSRIDRVIARVRDQEQGDTSSAWTLEVVTGTPSSGSPAAPAVPARSWSLGTVSIPAGTSTVISSSNITDVRGARFTAVGGVQPVLSSQVPSSPSAGQTFYVTDLDELWVRGASGSWRKSNMTPLPDPVYAAVEDYVTVTASDYANLATRCNVSITLPKQAWCDVIIWATLVITSGSSSGTGVLYAHHGGSGATAWSPGGIDLPGTAMRPNAGVSTTDGRSRAHVSSSWTRKLNAGTTTVEVMASQTGNVGTAQVLPTIGIIPRRYVSGT